jgi:hypothetical protein
VNDWSLGNFKKNQIVFIIPTSPTINMKKLDNINLEIIKMSPHGPQKKKKKKSNHFFSLTLMKGTTSLQSQSKFNTKSFNWVCPLTITYLPTYLPTIPMAITYCTSKTLVFNTWKMSTRVWEVGNDGYIGTYLLIYLPTYLLGPWPWLELAPNSAQNCCYYKFQFKRITTPSIIVKCQGL